MVKKSPDFQLFQCFPLRPILSRDDTQNLSSSWVGASMRKPWSRVFLLLLCCGLLFSFYAYGRPLWQPVYLSVTGKKLPASALDEAKRSAELRLRPYLVKAGFTAYPNKVALLAFKTEKRMELWGEKNGAWTYIRTYAILAASGKLGPKLKEGDRQVPEGIYNIDYLNAASDFYLSLRLDYPNSFDQQKAAQDGRGDLGGDICIHGWEVSTGCLAVGNVAVEELFLIASKATNTKVIIAPYDLRVAPALISPSAKITWLKELYGNIERELKSFKRPK